MLLVILLYFLLSQNVSGTTMPIISRAIACSPDTTPAYPQLTSNLQHPKNETTNVVINIIVLSS